MKNISRCKWFRILFLQSYWGVTMVELIALIYKDQHNATMIKLLNNWLDAPVYESSEDNESNTSSSLDKGRNLLLI